MIMLCFTAKQMPAAWCALQRTTNHGYSLGKGSQGTCYVVRSAYHWGMEILGKCYPQNMGQNAISWGEQQEEPMAALELQPDGSVK